MRSKLIFVVGLLAGALLLGPPLAQRTEPLVRKLFGGSTVGDRLEQHGEAARARLLPRFREAGVRYPPGKVILVGLKREKRLLVYAADAGGAPRFVRAYPILGASGGPGPKLREGDLQVPEGLYRLESLNPRSRYHLALRVSYPNERDREQARREGREDLGGDIMIHGGSGSVGCLALGDEAAEDLFVLAAECGLEGVSVVLSPRDFRSAPPGAEDLAGLPPWTAALYEEVRLELVRLPPADAGK